MQLSREVPKHTKTEHFNWCKKGWLKMTPRFRELRSICSNKMDTCFWCRHKFKDGEEMALAQPKKRRNKVLCDGCADALLRSDTES